VNNSPVVLGEITGIKTTPDGGWRMTIDFDASQSKTVVKLNDLRDQVLHIAFVNDAEHKSNID